MKYYFSLLLLHMLSSTTTASGIAPMIPPPRPGSGRLHRSRPPVVEKSADTTPRSTPPDTSRTVPRSQPGTANKDTEVPAHQRREAEITELQFKDLNEFFKVHDNKIKVFEWGQFNYLLSMSKVYVPPKYRHHEGVMGNGRRDLSDPKLDRQLLEANVQAVIGLEVDPNEPVGFQVDFQITDFFLANHNHGIGTFQAEEFETWWLRGRVSIPAEYTLPDGHLDKDKFYATIRDLEKKAGADLNFGDIDQQTGKSHEGRSLESLEDDNEADLGEDNYGEGPSKPRKRPPKPPNDPDDDDPPRGRKGRPNQHPDKPEDEPYDGKGKGRAGEGKGKGPAGDKNDPASKPPDEGNGKSKGKGPANDPNEPQRGPVDKPADGGPGKVRYDRPYVGGSTDSGPPIEKLPPTPGLSEWERRFGKAEYFVKWSKDEEKNWLLNLRNCFQPDPNYAGKVGKFDIGVFTDKWNANRLQVPKEFIAKDYSLKLAELDKFISGIEGSDFKTFGFKMEELILSKAPQAKIRGAYHRSQVMRYKKEHLPAEDMPTAEVRPSLQPSSEFGRLRIHLSRVSSAVGEEVEILGQAIKDLTPARISSIATRITTTLDMTLADIAVAGAGFLVFMSIGFIIEGIIKAVNHHCEKHHGGPSGCARHHEEEAALRQQKIDDRHSEAKHKGEHIKEEKNLPEGPTRTALEQKHRQMEKDEHEQNNAHRKQVETDHNIRDKDNEANERAARAIFREIDAAAKAQEKKNKGKPPPVEENEVAGE